jgi:predicted flap endonuclease-1-like 5' DNA nuclease
MATAEMATAEMATAEMASSDDLTVIEGIGPKIASVLAAAGIGTHAELASADMSRLEQILADANLRLARPETWPAQARLAADGRWDELARMQDELKGGLAG